MARKAFFSLFEKVCLPSLVRQTEKSFHWLLFMDVGTPQKFVRRMNELSSKYAFIMPIYMGFEDENIILREMRDRSSDGNTRIMTRLDNDDAINPSMIMEIQELAQKHYRTKDMQQGFFISFPLGYSLYKGDYYLQIFRCNPFISFVSDPDHEKTIFGWDHTKIDSVAPVVCKYNRPMWCQMIHEQNLHNEVRGLYWPWGKYCGLVEGEEGAGARSFVWQCKEFWRSFKKYLLHR